MDDDVENLIARPSRRSFPETTILFLLIYLALLPGAPAEPTLSGVFAVGDYLQTFDEIATGVYSR
jgi:hypothetical protein